MPASSQTHPRHRAFIADTIALILFFTTTGIINERLIATLWWIFGARPAPTAAT